MKKPELSKKQLEKNLYVTELKIKNVFAGYDYFKNNFLKVVGAAILLSFWAPFYSGQYHNKSILHRPGMTYWQLVLLTFCTITIACISAHFVWNYQDRKKIKRLEAKKKTIEKDLLWYSKNEKLIDNSAAKHYAAVESSR